ncbi:hypothetical protein PEC18_05110 [Paucibacter sp. O1-1]|nr:hypothetical protein [Paucibacter sp. O1-1]MDA3825249.1 hypothetical protein [Paucibacter sp. O1-1]
MDPRLFAAEQMRQQVTFLPSWLGVNIIGVEQIKQVTSVLYMWRIAAAHARLQVAG